MRKIACNDIILAVKEMCISINYYLSDDMREALEKAYNEEVALLGKKVIGDLRKNLEIACKEQIPICQDTGMAIIFIEIGQDVHIIDGFIEDAINEGVRQGYRDGYLRKSVVKDPIFRENTNDNTPAIIHYQIVKGDQIKITLAPKGFGSENVSQLIMLKPADGIEGIRKKVIETVKAAGPNACPPIVVGVGIGGDFEKSALLSKKALTREVGSHSELEHIKQLENELLFEINQLGIGPGGLGGNITALAVNIETYPTHIAGLPLAINICCHANRHITRVL